jgi:hypothetical protein
VLILCGLVALSVTVLMTVWLWCRRPTPKTKIHETLDGAHIHDSGLHYHAVSHLKASKDKAEL